MTETLPHQISLALGWWWARGMMHTGIYRYISDRGTTIKEIAGTSAGALIGACIAVGMSPDDIIYTVDSLNMMKLIDINLRTGFIKGEKIRQFLSSVFWSTRIEDCVIPLRITSTDIVTWEQVIHETWLLSDILRASISIPGIFAPYELNGRTLVDGGVIENLPLSVLSNTYPIIAVSTRSLLQKPLKTTHRILWVRINKSFFSISAQIVQKTIAILIKQNEEKSLFEARSINKHVYFLNPDSGTISIYDIKHMHQLINVWYNSMIDMFWPTNL